MEKLKKFSQTAIRIIALTVTVVIFLCLLTTKSYISLNDPYEISIYQRPSLLFYILFVASVVFLVYTKRYFDKIPVKALFRALSAAYIVFGVYLIISADRCLRSDAMNVFRSTWQISSGDYRSLQKGGYLYMCSNNIGIMSFFRVLYAISEERKFIFVVNLAAVIMTNYFIWKIADLIFGDETVNRYTVLCSFAYLPAFFFILFAYGTLTGFCCLAATLYFVLKYIKTADKIRLLFAACALITGGAAVTLKNNYVIGIIAIVIILGLDFLQNRKTANIMLSVLLLAMSVLPQSMLTNHYENLGGEEINGIPEILYVAMGMQEGYSAPGWWNGYNHDTFTDSDYDTEKSSELAVESIKERVGEFASNPRYFLSFYKQKTISSYCDPTCQSLWSGPSYLRTDRNESRTDTDNRILRSIYKEGRLYHLITYFCMVLTANIMLFAIIYQLAAFKKDSSGFDLFFLLYFIGGFMFHILLWEAKAQYMHTYYLALVPLAAKGLTDVQGRIKSIQENKDKTEEKMTIN